MAVVTDKVVGGHSATAISIHLLLAHSPVAWKRQCAPSTCMRRRLGGLISPGKSTGYTRKISIRIHASDYAASQHMCVTITVYQASPSRGPTLTWIGCPESIGVPPGVHTIYSTPPAAIATSSTISSTTSSGISSTATSDISSSATGDLDPSLSSGSNIPVIVGAIVGTVGGIILVLLGFVLGWRFAARKRQSWKDLAP
jgi:hypothetical protein